jgi:hypothetical protein
MRVNGPMVDIVTMQTTQKERLLLVIKMASGKKQLDEPFSLTARDDKLWARELSWAQQHGMTKMRCPCNKCTGKGRPILLDTV